ncbi:shikimate dehydrogenase [Sphingomonas profundi]|uniref:shikimate dehydrogenase n=1 Tax=Alterirhizorhabdus profundi TaxID=2681549 RepID=UPI0012E8AA1A|nr:shikimate dehydrogenase [Sphingomonas profundi]
MIPYAEVIGDPIAHSKSPLIHGFWLDQLGIEGAYRRAHVRAADLHDYFAARRADPLWRGCNVTVPHKQAVLAHCDWIDPNAATIGAVNTIVPENGVLAGYNTDGIGFLEPLRPLLLRPHLFRMARILGAGGAARAIAHALAGEGFEPVILARTAEKARAFLDSLGISGGHAAALEMFAAPTDFAFDDRAGLLDLVVNTTPLGMAGQPPLHLDFSHVPPGSVVYDIVYAPLETPLLAEARARGLRTIDGLEMLIGQAAAAFARFFGAAAPREHDAALRVRLVA